MRLAVLCYIIRTATVQFATMMRLTKTLLHILLPVKNLGNKYIIVSLQHTVCMRATGAVFAAYDWSDTTW